MKMNEDRGCQVVNSQMITLCEEQIESEILNC